MSKAFFNFNGFYTNGQKFKIVKVFMLASLTCERKSKSDNFSKCKSDFNGLYEHINRLKTEGDKLWTRMSNENTKLGLMETRINDQQIIAKHEMDLRALETAQNNAVHKLKNIKTRVIFFGSGCSGKSSVVNSLLGRNLFEAHKGYGTSFIGKVKRKIINYLLRFEMFKDYFMYNVACFVKLRLSDEYMVKYEKTTETFNTYEAFKERVNVLSGSISDRRLSDSVMLEAFIKPDNTSHVLQPRVELIDVPGNQMEIFIEEFLTKYCIEPNVFVYVMTTSFQSEDKSFFNYLKSNSARPNLYILINKSDEFEGKDWNQMDKEKQKLKERIMDQIGRDEMLAKGVTEQQIFFISAKEMSKLRRKKLVPDSLTKRQKDRLQSFEQFEEEIMKYIRTSKENLHAESELALKQTSDSVKETVKQLIKDMREIQPEGSYQDQHKMIKTFRQSLKDKSESDKQAIMKYAQTLLSENAGEEGLLMARKFVDEKLQHVLAEYEKKLRSFVDHGLHINLPVTLEDKAASWFDGIRRKLRRHEYPILFSAASVTGLMGCYWITPSIDSFVPYVFAANVIIPWLPTFFRKNKLAIENMVNDGVDGICNSLCRYLDTIDSVYRSKEQFSEEYKNSVEKILKCIDCCDK